MYVYIDAYVYVGIDVDIDAYMYMGIDIDIDVDVGIDKAIDTGFEMSMAGLWQIFPGSSSGSQTSIGTQGCGTPQPDRKPSWKQHWKGKSTGNQSDMSGASKFSHKFWVGGVNPFQRKKKVMGDHCPQQPEKDFLALCSFLSSATDHRSPFTRARDGHPHIDFGKSTKFIVVFFSRAGSSSIEWDASALGIKFTSKRCLQNSFILKIVTTIFSMPDPIMSKRVWLIKPLLPWSAYTSLSYI